MKTSYKLTHQGYWCFIVCVIFCYTHVWHFCMADEETKSQIPSKEQTPSEIPELITVTSATEISLKNGTAELPVPSTKQPTDKTLKSTQKPLTSKPVTKTSQSSVHVATDKRGENLSAETPVVPTTLNTRTTVSHAETTESNDTTTTESNDTTTTESNDTTTLTAVKQSSTPKAEPLTTKTIPAPPTQPATTSKPTTLNLQPSTRNPITQTTTKAPTVKPTTSVKLRVATGHMVTEEQPVEKTDGNVKPTSADTEDHNESTTKSSSDGADWFNNIANNSLISKLAVPIILGIIAAVFIICFAFGIRSCRKKPSRGRRKAMHNGRDHERRGNFDRMKLLADSSEDEF